MLEWAVWTRLESKDKGPPPLSSFPFKIPGETDESIKSIARDHLFCLIRALAYHSKDKDEQKMAYKFALLLGNTLEVGLRYLEAWDNDPDPKLFVQEWYANYLLKRMIPKNSRDKACKLNIVLIRPYNFSENYLNRLCNSRRIDKPEYLVRLREFCERLFQSPCQTCINSVSTPSDLNELRLKLLKKCNSKIDEMKQSVLMCPSLKRFLSGEAITWLSSTLPV